MATFDEYLKKYDLAECDIHLLDLIPLIEMIWVDNQNQNEELNILYRFALDHLCTLDEEEGEEGAVTEEQVNAFLDRFTQEQPDPQMLKDLRELCLAQIDIEKDQVDPEPRKAAILDHCLDIAAACAKAYPYKYNDRLAASEKVLIRELFKEFA